MDANFQVLLIMLGVALLVGGVAGLFMSERVRSYGVLGALRRRFSGGHHRSPYRR